MASPRLSSSPPSHGLVVGLLVGYGYMHNLFHGSEWGANAFQQGAIQATLVSTAALPLPQDHPPTDNVLATETPSVAPALEEQKQEPLPLPEAVPIPEKQPPPKPQAKPLPKAPPQHQPPPKPQNKANYGEAGRQAILMPRQPTTPRIAPSHKQEEILAPALAGTWM